MRTRSSRSYALEPVLPPAARDVYEIAGEGLLDCIEESFYLDDDDDDGDHDDDDHGEDEGEEVNLAGREEAEEEEIVVVQCPPKRQLIVRLRIPRTVNATSTLDAGSRRLSSDVKAISLAHKERPRLMITLRMPRSAGQVKNMRVVADPDQKDTSIAAVTKIEEAAKDSLRKELAEVKHWAETSSNGGDPKERHNRIELLGDLLPVQSTVQEDQVVKEQGEPDLKIDSKIEDPVSSESITVLSVEPGEDVSFVKKVDEEELVAAMKSEESKDMRSDLKDEAHVGRQPNEESHNPSEHGDSPTSESSTSSSHLDECDEALWPSNQITEDFTTSLVPTPLTMPSPELPLQQLATREPSPRVEFRKRRRSSVDETPESERYCHKRQKQREEGNEMEISIPRLKEATRGTGVLEAGLVAQQRRGVIPQPVHAPTIQTDTPQQRQHHHQQARRPVKKPKRKPLEKSGRQILLEQRMSSSSSQRPRGGGKAARAVMRPAKRKRK